MTADKIAILIAWLVLVLVDVFVFKPKKAKHGIKWPSVASYGLWLAGAVLVTAFFIIPQG